MKKNIPTAKMKTKVNKIKNKYISTLKNLITTLKYCHLVKAKLKFFITYQSKTCFFTLIFQF